MTWVCIMILDESGAVSHSGVQTPLLWHDGQQGMVVVCGVFPRVHMLVLVPASLVLSLARDPTTRGLVAFGLSSEEDSQPTHGVHAHV